MATNGTSPATAAPARVPGSRLAGVKRGALKEPIRAIYYGPPGVGKTTLAADMPDPILLDIEGGSGELDVARYPFRDEPGGYIPSSFDDVLAAVDDLTASPHSFQTMAVDTADQLEKLIFDKVCSKSKASTIEEVGGGYGKGYSAAVDYWRELLVRLERLHAKRGMNIVLVAHSIVKRWQDPMGVDFDRYILRMHEKSAGLLLQWVKLVGFVHFDSKGIKNKGESKAKGASTSIRYMRCTPNAAYDAKNRYGMPDEVRLDPSHPWKSVADAISRPTAASLRASIAAELERIGNEETTQNATAYLSSDDTELLTRVLRALNEKPSKGE